MCCSGVCFGVIVEGSPLVELLGADRGDEVGSYNGMSDGSIYGKLERYPLVE